MPPLQALPWRALKHYAAFTDPAVESTKTISYDTVGKGALPMEANYMQRAYAISSYNGYCPGIPDEPVEYYGNYVYQIFYGPHGTSCIVFRTGALKAYVIVGEIFRAWADLSENEPRRSLDITGFPVSDMYVDDEGNLHQDFENMFIIIDEEGEASYISRKNRILTFEVENGEVYMSGGNVIEVIVPEGTDLTSIATVFTVSENATCDMVSNEALDFTDYVVFTVTAKAAMLMNTM